MREIRGPLLALFAGVAILLMIACVNVASLLIARAASRARETSLRLALGASRGRLLRQSLVEGLILTLLGAAAGVLAGYVGLRVLLALAPESLAASGRRGSMCRCFAFTLAIVRRLGPAVLAGAADRAVARTRRDTPRCSRAARSDRHADALPDARALVVVQIALSVVLLVGAGLLVRAFVEVQRVDPGFRTDRHLTFRVALPDSRYGSARRSRARRGSCGGGSRRFPA